MSYFPESVYATVFAERQRVPAGATAAEAAHLTTGFFARFARVFGRGAATGAAEVTERDDQLEYHNPALGVRELRVRR